MNRLFFATVFGAGSALFCLSAEDQVRVKAESTREWDIITWVHAADIKGEEGDVWTPVKGGGPLQNSSANARGLKQSEIHLKGFDAFVSGLTDSELIEALAKQPSINLKTKRPYNTAEYFIAINGNKIILNEIRLRHSKRVLIFNFGDKYEGDWIFTGSGGIPVPLKSFIERLKPGPNSP